jgi:malate dehydrogenase
VQKGDVTKTNVTVVGGHSGVTILPLLSQIKGAKFSQEDKEALTKRIQFGGDEVVAAKGKAGGGSATLSMAYAGSRFTDRVLRALNGEKGLVECTYVQSSIVPGLSYFSSPVELGREGVEKIHGFGQIDAFENQKLEEMKKELTANIKKGEEFVQQNGAQFE